MEFCCAVQMLKCHNNVTHWLHRYHRNWYDGWMIDIMADICMPARQKPFLWSCELYCLLLFTSSLSSASPTRRPLASSYLCRQAPCQSSCRRSGRHGAPSPRRGNNLADRCTPECSRRRAGLDPGRQRWLGSAAACRSELESKDRADMLA